MVYDVTIDGKDFRLELERAETGWQCRLNGRDCRDRRSARQARRAFDLIGGKAYEIKREHTRTDTHLWVGSVRYPAELRDPDHCAAAGRAGRRWQGSEKNPRTYAR